MITRREELWLRKYNEMKEYILRVRHLPDKKKKENSVLVNWWKYNKKRYKQGLLSEEKAKQLKELSDMRLPGQNYFKGKRPKKIAVDASNASQTAEEKEQSVTQKTLKEPTKRKATSKVATKRKGATPPKK